MNSSEFLKKVNDELKDRDKKEILDIVNNLIRKIPKSKYDEVIYMLGNDDKLENIESKIEEYRTKFKMIDDLDLCFHATGYEDYDNYYWGDWIWEYSDDDNVGDLIKEATYYAVNLVNHKEYKYAKEMLDLIIYANYQFLDDDGGDFFEISLDELQEENLSFLFDTSLATCLYNGEVLKTSFNKKNNLFESTLLNREYKDNYNDEYTFQQTIIEKDQNFIQSIIKLDESIKKGSNHVKR